MAHELPLTSPSVTLGAIVTARPRAAALFERRGFDYCCGGDQTLTDACHERGLEPAEIEREIEDLEAEAGGAHHDVAGLTITQLSQHIVESHHDPARAKMKRIDELLGKVTRAHGEQDPGTYRLQRSFEALRGELTEHMSMEEESLFPACETIQRGSGQASDSLMQELLDTHRKTGASLKELREIGNDYDPDSAHCATHRVLLSELAEFELDLHQHIHEENNILFPRIRDFIDQPAIVEPE
ncbi:iron-sulfur cluster repair di-iron protein [soil metagenome]